MRHIRQEYNQCSLAALCQIDPSLNYAALAREFAQSVDTAPMGGRRMAQVYFFERIAPGYAKAMKRYYDASAGKGLQELQGRDDEPDLRGKGLLFVKFDKGCHVLSYEDGLVLDSAIDGHEPIDWRDYRVIHGATLLEVVPAETIKGE